MKKIIILFGPPASGKGTQSFLLNKKLKLPIISTGDLFRNEVKKKSKIGKKVKKILAKGNLVSDNITEKIIDKRLKKRDTQNGYILDGYPRKKIQLESLIARLETIKKQEDIICWALNIKVSDKEIKKRIGGRRVCSCGATYHLITNPPNRMGICDKCGKRLYQRSDDKSTVIQERLRVYHESINSILDYYKKQKKLIVIDGERNIREVWKSILLELKKVNFIK
jgi:adenylate kinase